MSYKHILLIKSFYDTINIIATYHNAIHCNMKKLLSVKTFSINHFSNVETSSTSFKPDLLFVVIMFSTIIAKIVFF